MDLAFYNLLLSFFFLKVVELTKSRLDKANVIRGFFVVLAFVSCITSLIVVIVHLISQG